MNKEAQFCQRPPLTLYVTPPHPCNYLPSRQAATVFLDPLHTKDAGIYGLLARQGFRRSGEHIYRPHCEACQACVPVRVPVAKFQPRRSQRRAWTKNQDVRVRQVKPVYRHEHFELYQRYLAARHPGGGMDADKDPHHYMHFLTCRWADTCFYEFRLGKKLLGVAVADRFENGLSALYNFFQPDYSARALGVYMALWEIQETARLGLDWLYLGYWIKDCRKMAYKTEYQPLEYYLHGEWRTGLHLHNPVAHLDL